MFISFLQGAKASPYVSNEDYSDLMATLTQVPVQKTKTEDIYAKVLVVQWFLLSNDLEEK